MPPAIGLEPTRLAGGDHRVPQGGREARRTVQFVAQLAVKPIRITRTGTPATTPSRPLR